MKEINISVSPLVKSILSSRYGHEPIRVNRKDILYTLLQGDPIRPNPNKNKLISNLLTEGLWLKVSDALHERLRYKNRTIYVGLYLHRYYKEEILRYVAAQNELSEPAQKSMKSYLDANRVSEDDYGLETAYAAWKRKSKFFVVKKSEVLATFPRKIAPYNVAKLYDPRDVLIAVNDYYESGFVNLLRKPITIRGKSRVFTYCFDRSLDRNLSYHRKVLCYFLHEYSNMNCANISKMINLPRDKPWRAYKEIEVRCKVDNVVIEDIAAILSLLSANPSPA